MDHLVAAADFRLSLSAEVFEKDIPYPTNTILYVDVESDHFCAQASLDVDIKSFVSFIRNLDAVYTSLQGSARIEEPFGHRCYLDFSAMTGGHIRITGVINSYGRHGFVQELRFENSIDQTNLKSFIESLLEEYKKYLH